MERKLRYNNLTRREFLLAVAAGATGYGIHEVRGWLSGREPDYEKLYFVGEGYAVERRGENKFRIIDSRGGNALPPDRMEHLHGILVDLQNNIACDIEDAHEVNHELEIEVANPQCMFELRDQLQQEE